MRDRGAADRSSIRLEARELRLSLDGRPVLDGASIALRAGEIATIEGASGSGKSTLLRVLSTLADADAGEVLLDGEDSRAFAPSHFRARVAFVMQDPPMLEGSVSDNLAVGPRLRGVRLDRATIARLLDAVGLTGFEARSAGELSGGERQRVALARALANEPSVLLLDEPTSALDPAAAARVLELVRRLAGDGLAVCAVTHTVEHAEALGGAHWVLSAGRLDARGEGAR